MSLIEKLRKAFHRHKWTKPREVIGYSNLYIRCLKCPEVMIEVGRPCGGEVDGLGTTWIPLRDWKGEFDRNANLEREDYAALEERARKDAFMITGIAEIADDLDNMGFETQITSLGGKDGSDLELRVRRKVSEDEH